MTPNMVASLVTVLPETLVHFPDTFKVVSCHVKKHEINLVHFGPFRIRKRATMTVGWPCVMADNLAPYVSAVFLGLILCISVWWQ